MRRLLLIASVLSIFIFLAWGNFSMAADYFPLIKGSWWEYKHSAGITGRVEVVGSKDVNGKATIHIRDESGNLYYIKLQDKIILYASPVEVFGEKNLILTIPPKKNARYDFIGKNGAYWTIIDTNATVRVPAGVFKKCVIKKMYVPEFSDMAKKMANGRLTSVYVLEYFAPEVGLVKREQLFYKETVEVKRQTVKELSRYDIAKGE